MKRQLELLYKVSKKQEVKDFAAKQLEVLENYSVNLDKFRTSVLAEAKTSKIDRNKEVKRFINIIEKERIFETMHIPVIIQNIFENNSQFKNNLILNYKLMNLKLLLESNKMNAVNVASHFLNELNMFEDIPVIRTNMDKIRNIFESAETELKTYLILEHIKFSKSSLIKPLVPILEEYFYDFAGDKSPREIVQLLEKYNFDRNIYEYQSFLKNKLPNSVNLNEHLNSDFKVENVYSIVYNNPAKINENYFFIANDIYLINEKKELEKIPRNHSIPTDFVQMNSVLENMGYVNGDEILFKVNEKRLVIGTDTKNDKYMIFGDKEITFNLNESLNVYENSSEYNYRLINTIKKIYENLDNLVEIDIAKKISSKKFPGQYAVIFKIDESKYDVRICNAIKNIDIFEKNLRPLQLREKLIENLDFEMQSDEIQKLIEADISKINVLNSKIQSYISTITSLQTESDKILSLDEEMLNNPEIIDLKNNIDEEIKNLQMEKKKLMSQLKEEMYGQVHGLNSLVEDDELEDELNDDEDPDDDVEDMINSEDDKKMDEEVTVYDSHDEYLEKNVPASMVAVLNGEDEESDQYNSNSQQADMERKIQIGNQSGKIISYDDAAGILVVLTDTGQTIRIPIASDDVEF